MARRDSRGSQYLSTSPNSSYERLWSPSVSIRSKAVTKLSPLAEQTFSRSRDMAETAWKRSVALSFLSAIFWCSCRSSLRCVRASTRFDECGSSCGSTTRAASMLAVVSSCRTKVRYCITPPCCSAASRPSCA